MKGPRAPDHSCGILLGIVGQDGKVLTLLSSPELSLLDYTHDLSRSYISMSPNLEFCGASCYVEIGISGEDERNARETQAEYQDQWFSKVVTKAAVVLYKCQGTKGNSIGVVHAKTIELDLSF